MILKDKIEYIWQYSRYDGNMASTAQRLYDNEEGYAALVILFNATELIFKSLRDNYSDNFNKDIAALADKGLLTEAEKDFFDSKEYGIREIRNIMTHREAYQYCLESPNGKALPFVEADTWMILYEQYAPTIIDILYQSIVRSKQLD